MFDGEHATSDLHRDFEQQCLYTGFLCATVYVIKRSLRVTVSIDELQRPRDQEVLIHLIYILMSSFIVLSLSNGADPQASHSQSKRHFFDSLFCRSSRSSVAGT